ncbi:unnamed protein product [Linum tenue]|uniref:Phospholipase D n=1 Tax=Linum tenue TaxID=586396 RepID=A0AAV0NS94_9ROSI|nr:unnamed protein product [Linum tenue]
MAYNDADSRKVIYLHGDLDLHVIEARRLPNMDLTSERLRRCFSPCNFCAAPPPVTTAADGEARDHKLHKHRNIITTDSYVTVVVPQATIARTHVVKNSQNPRWNYRFHLQLAHPCSELEFHVKDDDVFGAQLVGKAAIPAEKIASGEVLSGWFPIVGPGGQTPKPDTALRLEMKFIAVDKNPRYLHGIAGDPTHSGVTDTYFPLRKGSKVTLYQDAHVPCGSLPEIQLDGSMVYKQPQCWEDLCYAISEAHHMIYIVGWSVFHKIKLVREPTRPLPRGGDLTLGELLKYKSEEGVRVLLLVWDDKTSHDKFGISTAGTKAPRQPWHDLHSRIDGPAAYDLLINFEQRWRKATKWKEFGLRLKKVSHWNDDALIKIERISWIVSPPLSVTKDPIVHVSGEQDPENWHVQIFRSIDSGSLKGFPKTVGKCQAQNLTFSKNLVIDRSIQTAYIQAIRSAQHFIYIENQYFVGSSYGWPSYQNAGADNLIPMELALKIAEKIRANERFAVYVVMPMWPEGDPKSEVVQEILFWQSQTITMMYGVVAEELKSMQLQGVHPQDYLNFYCIGKTEEAPPEMLSGNGQQYLIQVSESAKRQRFMIYVHAKGMIVDDEYVIIGSANINQRSMAGTKDTETAMGAYQPHHAWAVNKRHPRGQIYGYRMSLWAEHLGGLQQTFEEPESLDCVKAVNNIAEENWRNFSDPDFLKLQGHLLKYPYQVDMDGAVSPLPGSENFPDVGGKVLGAHSIKIPDILTT